MGIWQERGRGDTATAASLRGPLWRRGPTKGQRSSTRQDSDSTYSGEVPHTAGESPGQSGHTQRDQALTSARSVPPKLVEAVVVNPHVVGELVDDGDRDLLHEVIQVLGQQAQRDPVEADPVRQRAAVVVALGERHPVVQTQDLGV